MVATSAMMASDSRRLVVSAAAVDAGILAAAGVLAVALRLLWINELGVNSDEAVYLGQGASLAGNPALSEFFPVFRAHPLFFQIVVSVLYVFGGDEFAGRIASAAFGVATVGVVFLTGRLMYGRRAGSLAALLIAVMPYHVIVTRQVLLDGPMVFFSTFALYFVARYARTTRGLDLLAAGASAGLAFLAKETSIILLGSLVTFFAISPSVEIRLRHIVWSGVLMLATMVAFPLALTLGGRTETGGNYLTWQLLRRQNHGFEFYPTVVPPEVGLAVIAAAVAGLWFFRSRRSWRETLLLCWIAVPVCFFEVWPVKGFQYLLPAAPAIAILAARTLAAPWRLPRSLPGWLAVSPLRGALTLLTVLSLALPAARAIRPAESQTFLAGSGGLPGGREAGRWIHTHVPEGAVFMTVGPSMANIVQFYGNRRAYALSVSPNPLYRNPSYEPIINPDARLRNNDIQYVVWDAFSASRSKHFSEQLMNYVRKYNGTVLHTESFRVAGDSGDGVDVPIIVIYSVHP